VLVPKKTPFGICAKLGQRTLAVYSFHYVAIFYIFEKFKFRDYVFERFGAGGEWLIIPIALAITLFFSANIFQKLLLLIMNVPKRKNINSENNISATS
jgi:fucose 4-O-acetylase-like acetyltransferase